jgi:hypothetical protein
MKKHLRVQVNAAHMQFWWFIKWRPESVSVQVTEAGPGKVPYDPCLGKHRRSAGHCLWTVHGVLGEHWRRIAQSQFRQKIQPPENGKRGKLLSSIIKSGFWRFKGNITRSDEEWRKSAGRLLKLAKRPMVWGTRSSLARSKNAVSFGFLPTTTITFPRRKKFCTAQLQIHDFTASYSINNQAHFLISNQIDFKNHGTKNKPNFKICERYTSEWLVRAACIERFAFS